MVVAAVRGLQLEELWNVEEDAEDKAGQQVSPEETLQKSLL